MVVSQPILKKMFRSLLKAVCITLYFIILNLAYTAMKEERLINDIKVFAGVFLIVGIYFLEKAYKDDDGMEGLSGIEFLIIALHSLSIMHVITLFKYDFRLYLLTSSYVFSIYFVLKAIILYTKGRKEYLQELSDISEIVKKDEPQKKEAKKRTPEEMEKRIKHKKQREEEIETQVRKKKKKKAVTTKPTVKTVKTKKETTKRPVKKTIKIEEPDEQEKPVVKKKKTTSKTKTTKHSATTSSKTHTQKAKLEEKPKKTTAKKQVKKKKIE